MTDRCACCDRPLSPVARVGAWCLGCTQGLQTDARLLRSGDRDEIAANVAWLLDRGCLTWSRYITKVPFDDA